MNFNCEKILETIKCFLLKNTHLEEQVLVDSDNEYLISPLKSRPFFKNLPMFIRVPFFRTYHGVFPLEISVNNALTVYASIGDVSRPSNYTSRGTRC